MKIRKSSTKASALLITLVLMALLTILIVALFETASLEQTSSASNLEETRAEFCAEQALERVTATLRSNLGNTNSYWISEPGQIIVSSEATNLPDTPVSLSSGLADSASISSTTASFHPANLNIPSFSDSTNFLVTEGENINGTLVPMQMKWIYVRSDGALDTNDIPVTTETNDPIIGRYAYWTDDESSKINYNLAWTRNATNTGPIGYPTMVNLTALPNMTSSMADSIHNSITLSTNYATLAGGYFNSPDDGRRVSSSVAAALNGSHFDLTHYNSDPDMTFFNQPKIVLTTQANRVPTLSDGVTLPYINILTAPNTDPGVAANLSSANINTTMQMLVGYLTRTDWPMAQGSSFQQKYNYTGSSTNRIAQLAVNIIDYVRCKESAQALVAPLRILQTGNTYALSTTSSTTGQYDFLGTGRGPFIDEIGVWFPASMTGAYNADVVVELYLPPNYGLPSVDLTQLTLFTEIETAGGSNLNANNAITAAEVTGGSTTLLAGQYAVITQPVSITASNSTFPASPPAVRPTTTYLRCDLQASSGKLTITPLVDGTNYGIPSIVDPTTITSTNIHSRELDDPRLGQYSTDWHRCSSGNNSFGSANSASTLGSPPSSTISPQQDTDASGNISSASLFMPPPAGAIYTNTATGSVYNNTSGMVNSVGELGFVDTGIQSYATNGIAWRSLRLQPSNEPNSVVPDWALMDLFTVPLTVTSTNAINSTNAAAIFTPNGTSVGGRININSQLQPFSPAPIASSSWPPRVAPLTALFYGAGNNSTNTLSTNSLAAAEAIATNIYNGTLASTANGNGKAYGTTSNYISPGQLAEIAGVADGGEASEETLRQVASLTTVRGNVFTVYSIGQALKQTPSGILVITGERRLQSMIERYVDATGTVNFRIVYFRAMSQSP